MMIGRPRPPIPLCHGTAVHTIQITHPTAAGRRNSRCGSNTQERAEFRVTKKYIFYDVQYTVHYYTCFTIYNHNNNLTKKYLQIYMIIT
jgi:hypothetical protein